MSMLKSLILVAALGASSTALAAPARLNDSQFLELNRCRALTASTELGGGDTKAVDALLKAQSRGREEYITSHGDELAQDAARTAHRATGEGRARLIAERDGTCQSLTGGMSSAGGSTVQASAVH
ncbi:MAG TPA: hypothetical protein VF459_00045 [Caulobacteraceae bacterium]